MLIVFPKTAAVEPNDLVRLKMEHDDQVNFQMPSEYEPDYGNGSRRGGKKYPRSRLAKLISSHHGIGDIPGLIITIGEHHWAGSNYLLPLMSSTFSLLNSRRNPRDSNRYDTTIKWDEQNKEWSTDAGMGTVVKSDRVKSANRFERTAYGRVVGVRSIVAALLTLNIKLPYNFLTDNFDHISIVFEPASKKVRGPRAPRFSNKKHSGEVFVKYEGTWFAVKFEDENVLAINVLDKSGSEVKDGRVVLAEDIPTSIFNIKTIHEIYARADMYIDVNTGGWDWGPDEENEKSLARGKQNQYGGITLYFPLEEERYTEAGALEMFARLGIEGVDHYDEVDFTTYGSVDGSTVLKGKHDFGIMKTLGVFMKQELVDRLTKNDDEDNKRARTSFKEFGQNLLSIDPAGISDIDIRRICSDWRIRTFIEHLIVDPKFLESSTDSILGTFDDYCGHSEPGEQYFSYSGEPIDDEASLKIAEAFKLITETRVVYMPLITPRIDENSSNQLAHLFERRICGNYIEDNRFGFNTINSKP